MYDLAKLDYYREPPICENHGIHSELDGRKGVYTCKQCDFSVVEDQWDKVALHSAVILRILQDNDIEAVSYHGVAIDIDDVVLPSHLLPHFILAAYGLAQSAGINDSISLAIVEITEEALESGDPSTFLLDAAVRPSSPEVPLNESLQLFASVTLRAIRDFRATDPAGSIMPSTFVFDYNN